MNMPSMPSMPGLPKQENSSSGEAQASQAPFTEESVGNSADSDVGLDIPSHDPVAESTPQIQVSAPAPSNEVKAPVVVNKGIKVVATRKGFYNQMRYKEGDQFIIRSKEDFGEWMKCVDSSMEKERLEIYKQKKLNQKKV